MAGLVQQTHNVIAFYIRRLKALRPVDQLCTSQTLLLTRKGEGKTQWKSAQVVQIVLFNEFLQTTGDVIKQLQKINSPD